METHGNITGFSGIQLELAQALSFVLGGGFKDFLFSPRSLAK